MMKFKNYLYIPKNFTGICRFKDNNSINHYKNGKHHREDGPAIIRKKNYLSWCYKDKCYGFGNQFTIESWKEKVEELKRKEELEIFK